MTFADLESDRAASSEHLFSRFVPERYPQPTIPPGEVGEEEAERLSPSRVHSADGKRQHSVVVGHALTMATPAYLAAPDLCSGDRKDERTEGRKGFVPSSQPHQPNVIPAVSVTKRRAVVSGEVPIC